jgi:hypothetical protein
MNSEADAYHTGSKSSFPSVWSALRPATCSSKHNDGMKFRFREKIETSGRLRIGDCHRVSSRLSPNNPIQAKDDTLLFVI